MTIVLLHLRILQARRTISSVSWPYQLFLVALLILAITGTVIKASQPQGSIMLSFAFAGIIGSFHWFRPDYQFLRIYFIEYRWLCFAEYTVLSIPFLIAVLMSPNSYLTLCYLAFLLGLTYLIKPFRRTSGKTKSLSFIPNSFFEWKSGLRKYFYPMLTIWLLGMLFSFQMGASIISIFLLGLISLGFYDNCEPLSILSASQLGQRAFLWTRIKGLLFASSLMYLPLLLLFFVFHPVHWFIPSIIALVVLSYQFYALTIKYAFYKPNTKSSKNTVLLSLGALVFVLPFILPAIWVLTVRLYFKSIKKLSFYLNDYN